MTEITIRIEDWAEKLGVVARILGYYELLNSRRFSEAFSLVEDDATYTAPFDGKNPEALPLQGVNRAATAGITDLQTVMKRVTQVGPNIALSEWEAHGTFPNGEPLHHTGVSRYEFSDEGKLKAQTSFFLSPAIAARVARETGLYPFTYDSEGKPQADRPGAG